mmetsp:Transcript_3911/g.11096  ORF Transcript_3911/g.11096 Transcript_3911/m.11096 type:complete len:94 (-) Transcript_3911:2356-2637(-)
MTDAMPLAQKQKQVGWPALSLLRQSQGSCGFSAGMSKKSISTHTHTHTQTHNGLCSMSRSEWNPPATARERMSSAREQISLLDQETGNPLHSW